MAGLVEFKHMAGVAAMLELVIKGKLREASESKLMLTCAKTPDVIYIDEEINKFIHLNHIEDVKVRYNEAIEYYTAKVTATDFHPDIKAIMIKSFRERLNF